MRGGTEPKARQGQSPSAGQAALAEPVRFAHSA